MLPELSVLLNPESTMLKPESPPNSPPPDPCILIILLPAAAPRLIVLAAEDDALDTSDRMLLTFLLPTTAANIGLDEKKSDSDPEAVDASEFETLEREDLISVYVASRCLERRFENRDEKVPPGNDVLDKAFMFGPGVELLPLEASIECFKNRLANSYLAVETTHPSPGKPFPMGLEYTPEGERCSTGLHFGCCFILRG